MVERTLFGPGGATEDKQDDILASLTTLLTELQQKLETGGEVALNAATLAALESITATVANFPADYPSAAVLAKLETIRVLLAATLTIAGTVAVSNFPATQPVSAASLPLPAGASTEATLALIKAKTDNLDVALSTRAVTGLTDAQLRASPVPVSGAVTTGGLTDAQLRASSVPVSGPLTDAQLRATAVPVSGTVTASGPLTDAQLRAAAVAVSGTFFQATQPVSGPLTDTQLRAAGVPVLEGTGLVPKVYDFIDLGYDVDDNLNSVVYKSGGAGGTTVATLALSYSGGMLDTVVRT